MSAPTRAATPQAVERSERDYFVVTILEELGLDGVEADDVRSIHIGTRTITVRRNVRGRRGKIVPGMTTTTTHRILPQPIEDDR